MSAISVKSVHLPNVPASLAKSNAFSSAALALAGCLFLTYTLAASLYKMPFRLMRVLSIAAFGIACASKRGGVA